MRSWSVACSFLYLATQLPTVWGTRSYEEATEEMVRSFSMTSRTTWALNSSEYLAAGIVFILSTHGKKNSPSPRNTTHPTFDVDSSALTDRAKQVLDEIVKHWNGKLPATVTVVGYMDSVADEAHNQTLSEQRAKAVANYLTS